MSERKESPAYEYASRKHGVPDPIHVLPEPKSGAVHNLVRASADRMTRHVQTRLTPTQSQALLDGIGDGLREFRDELGEELHEFIRFTNNRACARILRACHGKVGDAIAAKYVYGDSRSMRERAAAFEVQLNELSRQTRKFCSALGFPFEGLNEVTPSIPEQDVWGALLGDDAQDDAGGWIVPVRHDDHETDPDQARVPVSD